MNGRGNGVIEICFVFYLYLVRDEVNGVIGGGEDCRKFGVKLWVGWYFFCKVYIIGVDCDFLSFYFNVVLICYVLMV